MTTIFGKIVRGEIPCEKVFENDRILAFNDIAPKAPVHILIIPKKEIPNLQSVSSEDMPLITEMISVAKEIADKKGIANGYRLLTNNGKDGGQVVEHLHFHLIGGKPLQTHTDLG
jgi:histidine triad (HIT) family protein